LTLSSRRAGDVVTYLISQGVNPSIISAKGFGDTHPVAPNDTLADQAKNRRIVITVPRVRVRPLPKAARGRGRLAGTADPDRAVPSARCRFG
jgi:hypothetical protein